MMNGQNPINPNNSNIPNTPATPIQPNPIVGLDQAVLGSVQPVDSLDIGIPTSEVAPMPNVGAIPSPVQPSPMPNNNPGGYVATQGPAMMNPAAPIPGSAGGVPPMGTDPINSNAFVEPQRVENVGSVPPPAQPELKKKSPISKVLFIILILALIGGVAFGVYYYLSLGKSETGSITPKTLSVGVGETLPIKIEDYATFSGISSSNCTFDATAVDVNTVGSYNFRIKCNEDVYSGTINVVDNKAPSVALKIVYAPVNGTLTVDDFVESCDDVSNCTTTFSNNSAVTGYLATAGGPYNVDINVVDDANNSKIVTGILYVVNYVVRAFNNCSSVAETLSGYSATRSVVDKLAFGSDGTTLSYLNAGRREYTYVFTNETQYAEVVGAKLETITFDGHTGLAIYDDENNTLIISEDLSLQTLSSEANGAFPSSFVDVKTYYETTRGFTCQTKIG